MRTVHLHGAIGKKYGRKFDFEVDTAGDALRALAANFPSFMSDIREGSWHLVRGNLKTGMSLGEEDVIAFHLGSADLHILPYVAGSKNGGTLKIILGVVLMGVAFAFSGGALATPILGGGGIVGGVTYGNLAMLGAVMALSGVSQLLSPEEKSEEKKGNFAFTGPGNAYEQGNPVPLVYGEVITGSLMISGGINIETTGVDRDSGSSNPGVPAVPNTTYPTQSGPRKDWVNPPSSGGGFHESHN